MGTYTEHNVKEKAVTIFIGIIARNNKSLGDRLAKYRDAVYQTALVNIQRIGIHAYAKQVLARKSEERLALEEAIERERLYAA